MSNILQEPKAYIHEFDCLDATWQTSHGNAQAFTVHMGSNFDTNVFVSGEFLLLVVVNSFVASFKKMCNNANVSFSRATAQASMQPTAHLPSAQNCKMATESEIMLTLSLNQVSDIPGIQKIFMETQKLCLLSKLLKTHLKFNLVIC